MTTTLNSLTLLAAAIAALPLAATSNAAPIALVNTKVFDLAQFNGATVTYRADGQVGFDGKLWDNAVGVDLFTLGELAAGQFGGDPGDQVSLNDTDSPDWLQLNYATPQVIGPGSSEFVVFEISSSSSGVDTEGLAWKIGFNGDTPVQVLPSQVTHYAQPTPTSENTNMAVFNLLEFGFSYGDAISTVYIENVDLGSGVSDPDFIFAGMTVPEPSTVALLGLAGVAGLAIVRRRRV